MGKHREALAYFNKALDLDPKDINQVKSMIDRIHQQQEMADEGDDEFRWFIFCKSNSNFLHT